MPQSNTIQLSKDSPQLFPLKRQLKLNGFSMNNQARYAMNLMIKQALTNFAKQSDKAQGSPSQNIQIRKFSSHHSGREKIDRTDSGMVSRVYHQKKTSARLKQLTVDPLQHSLQILIKDVMSHQKRTVITPRDINAALMRLCPIWPICK